MKAFIVFALFITLGGIFFLYHKNRDHKRLWIALATFGMLIALAIVGNVTRQILPLYLGHLLLLLFSWGGLLVYLIRDRYHGWIMFSPWLTIGLFLVVEFLTGSSHEAG
jgi:hypothetical protein